MQWVGTKQADARDVIAFFHRRFCICHEPFPGAGGGLGVLAPARAGDVVYCDPSYSHSQSDLDGAQGFDLDDPDTRIARTRRCGAFEALSLDAARKPGGAICDHSRRAGVFEREAPMTRGASRLEFFRIERPCLDGEQVADRLVPTHRVRGQGGVRAGDACFSSAGCGEIPL